LSSSYSEINFQTENQNDANELLRLVQIEIEKLNEKKQLRLKETNETKKRLAEYKNLSIQELYELTQRKFLKKIIQICDKMSTTRAYSRAFIFH
jgi:hypothetical protein